MAARICERCTLKYGIAESVCRACGGKLRYSITKTPDRDIETKISQERRDIKAVAAENADDNVISYRRDRLRRAGLSLDRADALARAKRVCRNGGHEFVVDVGRFERAVKSGLGLDAAEDLLGPIV